MISFASPWLLAALALLPVIWWLLRLTPPAPRQLTLPTLSLLRDLVTQEQTPSRTPWWLLALRLLIAALLIIGLAAPTLNPPEKLAGTGALVIVVDNNWAAARDWPARQEKLRHLLDQAAADSRQAYLLPTTATADNQTLALIGPTDALTLQSAALRITPQPWPSDWAAAEKIISQLPAEAQDNLIWLASGLGGTPADLLAQIINHAANGKIFSDAETNPLYLLQPPIADGVDSKLTLYRAVASGETQVTIEAEDATGIVLAQSTAHFPADETRTSVTFTLPAAIRNRLAAFRVVSGNTAGSVILLDTRWQHHPVGLVGDSHGSANQSLLDDLFYLQRALQPFTDLRTASLHELLHNPPAVIVLTDHNRLTDEEITALKKWVQQGGTLLRFAGEQLANQAYAGEADLLPVPLRQGDRALGGALSWATPQHLAAFPAASPFHDLQVPDDVTIQRQILAEPSSDLPSHSWAMLSDGTPLVTAKNLGAGQSILFHVPARAEWSNLPLSGLFVAMLQRLVDLSAGLRPTESTHNALPLYRSLDAFGQLGETITSKTATLTDFETAPVSPQHPPGLYGNAQAALAFNLGQSLPSPPGLHNTTAQPYQQDVPSINLQTILLTSALLLFLFDFALSLWLRGLLRFATLFILLLLPLHHASASTTADAAELSSKTYLAYVRTGNATLDQISAAGLNGLARALEHRTSLESVGIVGVDLSQDELAFYPLLYWPLSPLAAPLSENAAAAVNDYLGHGGMILFDSDTENPTPRLSSIKLPPLVPLPDHHVLKHSFYLLEDLSGRFNNGTVWIEPAASAAYDGVASVIVGSNNWAAAWAVNNEGQPLFPCVPGGEAQRERAFRFGVNLVIYALTGNYKDDQLHIQSLLDRGVKTHD